MTDALNKLRKLDRKTLAERLQAADAEAETLVPQAVLEGVAPVDLVALTGYSRDHIRKLCRAAGIEPLAGGRRPRGAKP